MTAHSLTVEIGAGCTAKLTWPGDGKVSIQVLNPDKKPVRPPFVGPWTRERIKAAESSELHHIVQLATHHPDCPPFLPHTPLAISPAELIATLEVPERVLTYAEKQAARNAKRRDTRRACKERWDQASSDLAPEFVLLEQS